MLAVDTEEVAVLEASLHPTTEAPPAFPEEPTYAPPVEKSPEHRHSIDTFASRLPVIVFMLP